MYTYTYMYVYVHVHVHVYEYEYVYVYVYAYVYVNIYIYIFVNLFLMVRSAQVQPPRMRTYFANVFPRAGWLYRVIAEWLFRVAPPRTRPDRESISCSLSLFR